MSLSSWPPPIGEYINFFDGELMLMISDGGSIVNGDRYLLRPSSTPLLGSPWVSFSRLTVIGAAMMLLAVMTMALTRLPAKTARTDRGRRRLPPRMVMVNHGSSPPKHGLFSRESIEFSRGVRGRDYRDCSLPLGRTPGNVGH